LESECRPKYTCTNHFHECGLLINFLQFENLLISTNHLTPMSVTFQTWPSIEQLHNVVKQIDFVIATCEKDPSSGAKYAPFDIALKSPVSYRGKVKLHGQNGAINIENGNIEIQSRSKFIAKDSGMGKLISPNFEYFKKAAENMKSKKFIVFGEYAGSGVQSGVALSKLGHQIFAIFSLMIDGVIVFEPQEIRRILPDLPKNFYILDWYYDTFSVDFTSKVKMEEEIEKLNQVVEKIDKMDPWVLEIFDVKGPGEGLVLYPISLVDKNGNLTVEMFTSYVFKAKGEQHRTVSDQKSVQLVPQKAENLEKFAKMMTPEPRLEQGVKEVGLDVKNTGKFVNWVKLDVEKEGKAEAEESGIVLKDSLTLVGNLARVWYLEQLKNKK
jgi:hypothetical protein